MSYTPPPPPPPGAAAPGGGYAAAPKSNQKAVWALVLGILSVLCCSVVSGIPALVLGNMAKKEINQSGGAQTGAGMAKAGVILGIISIVLLILYLVLLAAGVATFDFSTSTSTSP